LTYTIWTFLSTWWANTGETSLCIAAELLQHSHSEATLPEDNWELYHGGSRGFCRKWKEKAARLFFWCHWHLV